MDDALEGMAQGGFQVIIMAARPGDLHIQLASNVHEIPEFAPFVNVLNQHLKEACERGTLNY